MYIFPKIHPGRRVSLKGYQVQLQSQDDDSEYGNQEPGCAQKKVNNQGPPFYGRDNTNYNTGQNAKHKSRKPDGDCIGKPFIDICSHIPCIQYGFAEVPL